MRPFIFFIRIQRARTHAYACINIDNILFYIPIKIPKIWKYEGKFGIK